MFCLAIFSLVVFLLCASLALVPICLPCTLLGSSPFRCFLPYVIAYKEDSKESAEVDKTPLTAATDPSLYLSSIDGYFTSKFTPGYSSPVIL